MQLGREQLCRLIPHAGDMCLLESVVAWDEESIDCRSLSHQAANNPLRHDNALAAVNGVEYAAQAMAVHGALLSSRQEAPTVGYLAALRNVRLHVETLQQCGELQIHCHRLAGDANGFIYDFEVRDDTALLLSGRATVMMREENS